MAQVARNETMRRDFHSDSRIFTSFQPAIQNVHSYICFIKFRQIRHNRHGRKRAMPEWVVSNGMWSQIFAVGVPVAEKILRPVVVYAFLVVILRVFGKRELAQLNPFDLVVLLSLSNTVQNAIIGNDNSLTGGLIGAFTLLGVNYLVVRFLFRHRRLD